MSKGKEALVLMQAGLQRYLNSHFFGVAPVDDIVYALLQSSTQPQDAKVLLQKPL